MRRPLAAIAAFLAAALAACGGPSSTPVHFTAHDAGFTAEFPVSPQRSSQNVTQAGATLEEILYDASTPTEEVGVGYFQLPSAPPASGEGAFLDAVMNGSATNLKGTVGQRVHTTYLGHPAEDAVITAGSREARERILLDGLHVYILIGAVPSSGAAHPGYDRLLATFGLL